MQNVKPMPGVLSKKFWNETNAMKFEWLKRIEEHGKVRKSTSFLQEAHIARQYMYINIYICIHMYKVIYI